MVRPRELGSARARPTRSSSMRWLSMFPCATATSSVSSAAAVAAGARPRSATAIASLPISQTATSRPRARAATTAMEEDQMPPDLGVTVGRSPEGGYHVVSEQYTYRVRLDAYGARA